MVFSVPSEKRQMGYSWAHHCTFYFSCCFCITYNACCVTHAWRPTQDSAVPNIVLKHSKEVPALRLFFSLNKADESARKHIQFFCWCLEWQMLGSFEFSVLNRILFDSGFISGCEPTFKSFSGTLLKLQNINSVGLWGGMYLWEVYICVIWEPLSCYYTSNLHSGQMSLEHPPSPLAPLSMVRLREVEWTCFWTVPQTPLCIHTTLVPISLVSYPTQTVSDGTYKNQKRYKVLQVPSLYAEPILQSAEGILHTVVVMSVLTVWFMEGGRSLLIRVPSGTGGRSSLMCTLWVQHVAPLSSPPGLLVWFFIVLFPPISFCTLPTQCLPKMQNLLLAMARLNFISTGEGNLASQQWWTVSGILSLCLRAWFHWKTGFLGAFGELSVLFRFVIQCSFCFPPPTCFPSFNPLPSFSVSFSPQAFSFSSPPGCFVSYPSLVHGEETIEFC